MSIVLADVEANGLRPTEIHVMCVKDFTTGDKETLLSPRQVSEYVSDVKPKRWCFHNGLGYDVKVLNRLVRPNLIDPSTVIDTMVVSKLKDYSKFNTHSLKELGVYLGVHKGDYTGGWDVRTKEMVDYCEQDVEVLEAILKYLMPFLKDPDNKEALECEHKMAVICDNMHEEGFPFNKVLAENLLDRINKDIKLLEDSFKLSFPPKTVEDRRLKLKYTKEGSLYKSLLNTMSKEKTSIDPKNKELVVYKTKEFNPGSPKDRIDVLWDAGWKPTDKTDGYKKFEREARNKRWRR